MKVGYRKPAVEFEDYELNVAIATGCESIKNLGPGDESHDVCTDFIIDFGIDTYASPAAETYFYEGSCLCYLTAPGSAIFTS